VAPYITYLEVFAVQSNTPAPIAVRLKTAAKLIGLSERTLWGMVQRGEVPVRAIKHGSRTTYLFNVQELARWAAGERPAADRQLPEEPQP
jgi:predicted DNA-binding transcriptional regulator AlpA